MESYGQNNLIQNTTIIKQYSNDHCKNPVSVQRIIYCSQKIGTRNKNYNKTKLNDLSETETEPVPDQPKSGSVTIADH
jgi:hypothetical protein